MIKAIIFDFDGVIVESMDIKTRAFAFLFKDYPEHIDEIIKFHTVHGGLSRFVKFEWIYKNILQKRLSQKQKIELGKSFANYVYEEVVKCPFVNGALEFLNNYYQKIRLFIVSGTPQEEIRSIVKARNLERYFIEVFGTPKKKSALNSGILKSHRLNPEEIIVIGDSVDDYEGAREAGIRFVGRINNSASFKGLKVEALIKDLYDLGKVIKIIDEKEKL